MFVNIISIQGISIALFVIYAVNIIEICILLARNRNSLNCNLEDHVKILMKHHFI